MFASPLFLLLFIPLILIVLGYRRMRRSRYTYRPPPFSSEKVCNKPHYILRVLSYIPNVCIVSAIIISVFALANPQGNIQIEEEIEKGNRFALAFDISSSMSGKKIENAKKAAIDLIEKNPTDPFAVIPFTNTVKLSMGAPLTIDKEFVKKTLVRMKPSGSTDVSYGLIGAIWTILADLYVVHNLKDSKVVLPSHEDIKEVFSTFDSQKLSRLLEQLIQDFPSREGSLIIAITDAESYGDISMEDVVNFSGRLGIPIYMIGIRAHPNSDVQQALADSGGGFFPAQSSKDILKMYTKIDTLKPTITQIVSVVRKESFRQEFAWLSFFLLLIAFSVRSLFIVLE